MINLHFFFLFLFFKCGRHLFSGTNCKRFSVFNNAFLSRARWFAVFLWYNWICLLNCYLMWPDRLWEADSCNCHIWWPTGPAVHNVCPMRGTSNQWGFNGSWYNFSIFIFFLLLAMNFRMNTIRSRAKVQHDITSVSLFYNRDFCLFRGIVLVFEVPMQKSFNFQNSRRIMFKFDLISHLWYILYISKWCFFHFWLHRCWQRTNMSGVAIHSWTRRENEWSNWFQSLSPIITS